MVSGEALCPGGCPGGVSDGCVYPGEGCAEGCVSRGMCIQGVCVQGSVCPGMCVQGVSIKEVCPGRKCAHPQTQRQTPPVDRMNDTHLLKHYLADGKDCLEEIVPRGMHVPSVTGASFTSMQMLFLITW